MESENADEAKNATTTTATSEESSKESLDSVVDVEDEPMAPESPEQEVEPKDEQDVEAQDIEIVPEQDAEAMDVSPAEELSPEPAKEDDSMQVDDLTEETAEVVVVDVEAAPQEDVAEKLSPKKPPPSPPKPAISLRDAGGGLKISDVVAKAKLKHPATDVSAPESQVSLIQSSITFQCELGPKCL